MQTPSTTAVRPAFLEHGLFNPMIASAAMSVSSVSVILNALRLRRVKLDPAAERAGPTA